MIDFTRLNTADKRLMKVQKGIKFLDRMVKMVFYSTFLFAIITIAIAWLKDWEQVLIMLVDRWFGIMVGELVVTGIIQSIKEIVSIFVNKEVNNGL